MTVEAAAEGRSGFALAAAMGPVAVHLTAAGRTLPGHPVRPQDDVAAYRTGRRKQRTVNPPLTPPDHRSEDFLYILKAGPEGALGRQ
jgi:hypothetical protein